MVVVLGFAFKHLFVFIFIIFRLFLLPCQSSKLLTDYLIIVCRFNDDGVIYGDSPE